MYVLHFYFVTSRLNDARHVFAKLPDKEPHRLKCPDNSSSFSLNLPTGKIRSYQGPGTVHLLMSTKIQLL